MVWKHMGKAATVCAAASSLMMLSGFDSAMTASDVMEKATAAEAAETACTMDLTAALDSELVVGSDPDTAARVPVTGNLTMTVSASTDPFAAHVTGNFTGSAMGQDISGDFEEYIVPSDDGTGTVYSRTDMQDTSDGSSTASAEESGSQDSGWQSIAISAEDMSLIQEAAQDSADGDYSTLKNVYKIDLTTMMDNVKSSAVLAPAAVSVNGKECAEVSFTVPGTDIQNVIDPLLQSTGDSSDLDASSLSLVDAMMAGLKIDAVADYDSETFLPVHMTADLSGSDFSWADELLNSPDSSSSDTAADAQASTESDYSMSYSVSTLKIEADYDFETPVSVTVPDEVAASAVPADSSDIAASVSAAASDSAVQ